MTATTIRPAPMTERVDALRDKLRAVELGGGAKRIEKQHARASSRRGSGSRR
jgi:hypothetical protein